ncbi:cointegrate resolution protein T [Salinisphaera sp. T5B8]|uniref:DNA-binding protein n=1 Tax=Salinisphaera sp. T5B8 TaxID=1304154 RepID=UPI003341A448
MATAELTPESLHDALRAILARGEYPSMAKVRVELGTTASQQTLTRHMKKAWQGLADQMGSGLPEGLPRVVVDAAHRFYEEARGYANEELERAKAQMQARETALKGELEESRTRIGVLEGQIEHLQQRAESAEAECKRLDAALHDSQKDQQAATARADKLDETLSDERTRNAEQRAQLIAEHERHLETAEKERARCEAGWQREIERSDSQQKAWARQIDDARQELREAQAKHDAEQKRIREELTETRETLQQRQEHIAAQQVEIQRLTDDRDRAVLVRDEMTTEIARDREAHEQRVHSLSDNLAAARSDNDSLRENLTRATTLAEERALQIAALQARVEPSGRKGESAS